MSRSNEEKKAVEARVLIAARKAGVPILLGDIPLEKPGFRFNESTLGVDVKSLRLTAAYILIQTFCCGSTGFVSIRHCRTQ